MTTTNTAKQLANRVARLEGALNHPMAGETALAAVLRDTRHRIAGLERQMLIDKECIMALERRVGDHTEWLEALGRHDDHHTSALIGIHQQLKDWKEAPAAVHHAPRPAEPARGLSFIKFLAGDSARVASVIRETWSREARIAFIKLLAGDL